MRSWLVVAVVVAWSSVAFAVTPPDVQDIDVRTTRGSRGSHDVFALSDGSIRATFSPDTVRVRIVLHDSSGHTATAEMTPDHVYFEFPGRDSFKLGDATATVTAYDATGAEQTTTVIAHVRRQYTCGLAGMAEVMALLLFVPCALIVLAIALFIRSVIRRRKLSRDGLVLPPLAAEAMAQGVIRYLLVSIAAGAAVSLLLYFTDHEIAAFLVAYVPFTRLFMLAGARGFLARLESGATATLHDYLLAASNDYIVVPGWVRRRAPTVGVPTTAVAR